MSCLWCHTHNIVGILSQQVNTDTEHSISITLKSVFQSSSILQIVVVRLCWLLHNKLKYNNFFCNVNIPWQWCHLFPSRHNQWMSIPFSLTSNELKWWNHDQNVHIYTEVIHWNNSNKFWLLQLWSMLLQKSFSTFIWWENVKEF